MAKELTVGGSALSLQDLMIETNSKGEEKKVVNCEIDGGLYRSEVEKAELDYEVVTKVNKFNGDYIQRLTDEAVRAGVNILKDNKEADKVAFVAPYLSDNITSRTSKIEIVVDRSKPVLIPGKGTEDRPVFGVKVDNKYESINSGGSFAKGLKQLLQDELGK